MNRERAAIALLFLLAAGSFALLAIREERIPSGPTDLRFRDDGSALLLLDREIVELAPDGALRSRVEPAGLGPWTALERFSDQPGDLYVCDTDRQAHAYPGGACTIDPQLCPGRASDRPRAISRGEDLFIVDSEAMRIERRRGAEIAVFGDVALEHRFKELREARARITPVQIARAASPLFGSILLLLAVFALVIHLIGLRRRPVHSLGERLALRPLPPDPRRQRARRMRTIAGVALIALGSAGSLAAILLLWPTETNAMLAGALAGLLIMLCGELLVGAQVTSVFARSQAERFLRVHGAAIERVLEPAERIHLSSHALARRQRAQPWVIGGHVLLTNRRLLVFNTSPWPWVTAALADAIPIDANASIHRGRGTLRPRLLGARFLELAGHELILAGEEDAEAIINTFERVTPAVEVP